VCVTLEKYRYARVLKDSYCLVNQVFPVLGYRLVSGQLRDERKKMKEAVFLSRESNRRKRKQNLKTVCDY